MEKEIFIDNFIPSFQAVIPMFCLLLIGVFVRKLKILGDNELPQVNSLVFSIFLPLLLFSGTYQLRISASINSRLILFAVAAVFAVYFGALFSPVSLKKTTSAGDLSFRQFIGATLL